MKRVSFRGLAPLISAWFLFAIFSSRLAADPITPFGPSITLEQMLTKGLKCRRSFEFEYVRDVVKLVDQGKLPESLVRSTFFWAWQKYRRPLQYFQQALSIRAAKIGLSAPGFNSSLSTARPTPVD